MENDLAVQSAAEPMTAEEARECCDRVRSHMAGARAELLRLYEGRGWEALGYETWRACVSGEFGQHQATLYRQLEAAQIERAISHDAKNGSIPAAQLRPLAALPPDRQPAAWSRALAEATGGRVTAADVQRIAAEVLEEEADRMARANERREMEREGRRRFAELAEGFPEPEIGAEERKRRTAILYPVFQAINTLAATVPPAEFLALMEDYHSYRLDDLATAAAWLEELRGRWIKG